MKNVRFFTKDERIHFAPKLFFGLHVHLRYFHSAALKYVVFYKSSNVKKMVMPNI